MKFSIITVCFNAADTIEQTIKSVINQNYTDMEYIIIDGDSTDGTLDIIKKYNDRIDCWISEKDSGIYHAMNKGIKRAQGDIIAFLNADDWYEDNVLNRVRQYFEKYDVEMIGGSMQYISDGNIIALSTARYDLNKTYLYCGCQQPALFVRKKVFEKVGIFNEEMKVSSDYEWTLRAWIAKVTFKSVPDIFTNFRLGGTSNIKCFDGNMEEYRAARRLLGENYYDEIESYYANKLEKYYYEQYFNNYILKDHIDLLRNYFTDDMYYIWGCGNLGGQLLHIFELLHINVKGFVDNDRNKWGSNIGKYKVYTLQQLEKNIKICIATRQYDEEVKKQIMEYGYAQNEYIAFSDIIKDIVMKQTGTVYSKEFFH